MSELDVTGQLERLEKLRANGALTQAEYDQQKKLLFSPASTGFVPDWRYVGRRVAVIIAIGAAAITTLLLMPAPKRAIDSKETSPTVASSPAPVEVSPTINSTVVQAPAVEAASPPDEAVAEYVPPKPVKGRCLLRIKGKDYIDGPCDISLDPDGSFDVIEHYDHPGYFAKVLRDGAGAHGFWNGARDSTHAHDDLGELKRNGACWENETAKVCAWS
jgi:hypothetical protein